PMATIIRPDTQGRAQLADFLRSRRARLSPADVGLPPGRRRRTPGLRREEVAGLAGVGVTWYTWLEQGREVRPSVQVLDAVAAALRLSTAERRYLYGLARNEEPPLEPGRAEVVPPSVQRVIDGMPWPAHVRGRRFDMLAWNRGVEALVGDVPTYLGGTRNIVLNMFTNPATRTLYERWPDVAQGLLAACRESAGRHLGDPWFDELIGTLTERSAEFRAWWPRHDVRGLEAGRKALVHPIAGRLVFEHVSFLVAEAPDLRL